MSGLKEEVTVKEIDGQHQTQLLGAQNPMSHSIAGIYLYSPGAVPL